MCVVCCCVGSTYSCRDILRTRHVTCDSCETGAGGLAYYQWDLTLLSRAKGGVQIALHSMRTQIEIVNFIWSKIFG